MAQSCHRRRAPNGRARGTVPGTRPGGTRLRDSPSDLPEQDAAPEAASANFFPLRLEIDHDVRDRYRKTLAGSVDDTSFEPVRTARRMGRDDHLVSPERAQGVLDGLQRVAVADLPERPD